jgi:hypothetical protein
MQSVAACHAACIWPFMYKLLRQYDQEQQGGSLEEGKGGKDAAAQESAFVEVRSSKLTVYTFFGGGGDSRSLTGGGQGRQGRRKHRQRFLGGVLSATYSIRS